MNALWALLSLWAALIVGTWLLINLGNVVFYVLAPWLQWLTVRMYMLCAEFKYRERCIREGRKPWDHK